MVSSSPKCGFLSLRGIDIEVGVADTPELAEEARGQLDWTAGYSFYRPAYVYEVHGESIY